MVNYLTLADLYHFSKCNVIAGIYKVTNLINGKYYIGQSLNVIKRLKEHKNDAYNKNSSTYNSSFHRAIRKYGLSNFRIEILETFELTKDISNKLNNAEVKYIKKYNTFDREFGYNQTLGGAGDLQIDPFNKKYNQLVVDYNCGETIYELSIKFEISEPTISSILKRRGIDCCADLKVDDSVVASLYRGGLSIRKIAKKLNVSACCIQRSLNRTNTLRRHHKAAKTPKLKMDT